MSIFEKLRRKERHPVEIDGYGVTVYVRPLTLAETADVESAEKSERIACQLYHACETEDAQRVFADRSQALEIDAPVALTLAREINRLTQASLLSVDEAEKK